MGRSRIATCLPSLLSRPGAKRANGAAQPGPRWIGHNAGQQEHALQPGPTEPRVGAEGEERARADLRDSPQPSLTRCLQCRSYLQLDLGPTSTFTTVTALFSSTAFTLGDFRPASHMPGSPRSWASLCPPNRHTWRSACLGHPRAFSTGSDTRPA